MAVGEDSSIGFSPQTDGRGDVVADAVKVIKVSSNDAPSNLSENEDPPDSKYQEVVKEVRKYTGGRYSFGKASRSGVDCSGLNTLVYRKFDVSLPHDVERQ